MRNKSQEPTTREEWQQAVDVAQFLLLLDSARQYGLIEGGPKVNLERAVTLIEKGKRRGVTPAPHDELIRRFIVPAGLEDIQSGETIVKLDADPA